MKSVNLKFMNPSNGTSFSHQFDTNTTIESAKQQLLTEHASGRCRPMPAHSPPAFRSASTRRCTLCATCPSSLVSMCYCYIVVAAQTWHPRASSPNCSSSTTVGSSATIPLSKVRRVPSQRCGLERHLRDDGRRPPHFSSERSRKGQPGGAALIRSSQSNCRPVAQRVSCSVVAW